MSNSSKAIGFHGSGTVLGEVATYEASTYLIDIRQVSSNSVLGTYHANTTVDLVDYFRNALLRVGGFRDEREETGDEEVKEETFYVE